MTNAQVLLSMLIVGCQEVPHDLALPVRSRNAPNACGVLMVFVLPEPSFSRFRSNSPAAPSGTDELAATRDLSASLEIKLFSSSFSS